MIRNRSAILFWGALWGLVEATLGFVLHRAAIALPGLPGFVMFPIAFVFLDRAIASTSRPSSAFEAACVAAAVKMVDFLVPGRSAIRILNPALSILLEGMAVWAVVGACRRAGTRPGLVAAFVMGLSWRVLFLGNLWVLSRFGLPAALVTDGAQSMLRFALAESLANALPIAAWLLAQRYRRHAWRKARPIRLAPAAALLSVALVAEFLLQGVAS